MAIRRTTLELLAGSSLAVLLCSCSCTLADCDDEFSASAHVDREDFPDLPEIDVRVCRNQFCSDAILDLTDPSVRRVDLRGQVDGFFAVSSTGGFDGVVTTQVIVSLTAGGEAGSFDDVERIVVDARLPDGSSFASLDEEVEFGTARPNGPYCGPACDQASAELVVNGL